MGSGAFIDGDMAVYYLQAAQNAPDIPAPTQLPIAEVAKVAIWILKRVRGADAEHRDSGG